MNITKNFYIDNDIWFIVHQMYMKEIIEEFNWKVHFYGCFTSHDYYGRYHKIPKIWRRLANVELRNDKESNKFNNETFKKYFNVMKELTKVMNYCSRAKKFLKIINYVNKITTLEGKGKKKTIRHPKKIRLFQLYFN